MIRKPAIPLLALLLLFSWDVWSQPYQTLLSNMQPCFTNGDGVVKCIRFDSVHANTDSVFYPFSSIRQVGDNCYTVDGAAWVGEKVIIEEDGGNLFFNKHNDTIKINTTARPGDSWTAYTLPDSISVVATVTNVDTVHFLGQSDSAKTIGFQVFDKNMDSLSHELNTMQLVISREYGFISTVNFYLFPGLEEELPAYSYYPEVRFEPLNLAGLSDPNTGIQNLTRLNVYDFQPGDELDVREESTGASEPYYHYQRTRKIIYKYLERTDYPDSVGYEYSRTQSTHTQWHDSSSFQFSKDTLTVVYKPDSTFDSNLPWETISSKNVAYSLYMISGEHLTKTIPSDYDEFWPSNTDTCWEGSFGDGYCTSFNYLKGLGGPYYDCESAFGPYSEDRQLVYYQKGQKTWGEPLTVTGNSGSIGRQVQVYPNPAENFILVRWKGLSRDATFELMDVSGRVRLRDNVELQNNTIDITSVGPGVYFYRIHQKDNEIISGKIIVQ